MPEIDKTSLQKLLLGIDEEAYMTMGSVARRSEVVIVGGGAFMLLDLTVRQSTHDVDVLQASSLVREILARHPAVNGGVAAYADQLPYNFEDRLIRLELDTLCVDYFTPSVEDLVVMKLYAWRPNDVADLTSGKTLEAIDWDLLDRLVYSEDEARASALSERRYREMVGIYGQYREKYRDAAHV